MSQALEIRNLSEPVEVHSSGTRLVAVGYAARYDALSQNLGGFVERISPTAFRKTLKQTDVRALFNHQPDFLLGTTRSGTLRLSNESDGLAYEIDLPDTTVGRDVATLLERGDITGSSFGFRTIADDWDKSKDGFPVRTLKEVALRDIGPVTFPAYPDASSALRSLAEARSLNFDQVAAAAADNKLSDVLWTPDAEDEQRHEEDRPEAIRIVRSPLAF